MSIKHEQHIVVLPGGFVFVGELHWTDTELHIINAKNIRTWGTTQGLGELALKGPTKDTKLDACSTVHIARLPGQILFVMPCLGKPL